MPLRAGRLHPTFEEHEKSVLDDLQMTLSSFKPQQKQTMMRRSGSFQPSAAPRSGDSLSSFSSSTSRKQTRRTKRRRPKVNAWAFVIRVLLVIVAFLSVFDLALFWKRKHSSTLSQEEEAYHNQKNRLPPLSVEEHTDETRRDEEDMEPIYEILRQARIHPAQLDEDTKESSSHMVDSPALVWRCTKNLRLGYV